MPRSRSISIQSLTAARAAALGLHRAGELDRSAVEQELLGERGLAGVRMRDDRERLPAPNLMKASERRSPMGLTEAGRFQLHGPLAHEDERRGFVAELGGAAKRRTGVAAPKQKLGQRPQNKTWESADP